MIAFSDYLEEQVLRHFFRGDEVGDEADRPTQYQMSLHSDDPGDEGADNEIAGNGYIRQPISFDIPFENVQEDSNDTLSDVLVEFEGMPAITVTHAYVWGFFDPNWVPLMRLILTNEKVAGLDDTLTFNPGEIILRLK